MIRRIFYGGKPRLSAKDTDSFSRGNYKCQILLQTKKGQPVAISQHQDRDIWKVQHGFSTLVFATKGEALAYCKDRFLDLDGQAV